MEPGQPGSAVAEVWRTRPIRVPIDDQIPLRREPMTARSPIHPARPRAPQPARTAKRQILDHRFPAMKQLHGPPPGSWRSETAAGGVALRRALQSGGMSLHEWIFVEARISILPGDERSTL